MVSLDEVKQIIGDVLQIGERTGRMDADTALLGSIPEFDSMAVVSVITALEDQFAISVDDDEISADTFETLGNLHAFVNAKLGA